MPSEPHPLFAIKALPPCLYAPLFAIKALPSCLYAPLSAIKALPPCLYAPLFAIKALPSCLYAPLSAIKALPPCLYAPLFAIKALPSCLYAPLSAIKALPPCLYAPLFAIKALPSCLYAPLSAIKALPPCLYAPLFAIKALPPCLYAPLSAIKAPPLLFIENISRFCKISLAFCRHACYNGWQADQATMAQAAEPPRGKPVSLCPMQRAVGRCEAVCAGERSTFRAADESRKGKPFTAVQEVRFFSGNLGGNAGIALVPRIFFGHGSFFVPKRPCPIDLSRKNKGGTKVCWILNL